ncbi:craniofacial development protein 2-like [Halyomorpha halys]|uniref:craniofacial development protein 2-like n=1 Tax=Halyomorpha halys TaxID=286706 RepID=UPI0034D209CD
MGEVKIQDYTHLYSGVNNNERAAGGVGFLFHEDLAPVIKGCKFVSNRIMVLDILEGDRVQSVMVAYGPNKSAVSEEKDTFFNDLQREVDDCEGIPIVLGHLYGRVGCSYRRWPETIERYGKEFLNDNGERIISFCMPNDLVITNTLFPHE